MDKFLNHDEDDDILSGLAVPIPIESVIRVMLDNYCLDMAELAASLRSVMSGLRKARLAMVELKKLSGSEGNLAAMEDICDSFDLTINSIMDLIHVLHEEQVKW